MLLFGKKEAEKAWEKARIPLSIQARIERGRPESFEIAVRGNRVKVTGGDEVGLMYGLLQCAEDLALFKRIKSCRKRPFLEYRMLKFNPPLKGNAYLSRGDAERNSWFFDIDYWNEFFRFMAVSR